METSALRQLLKSFCNNSHWKYAVFWRLKHQNPMLLTWEDGYCDYPNPREPVESISDDIYLNNANDISSLNCEIDGFNGSYRYPVELAVANMSCLQYAFGEGVVGEVANTGNHCWVFTDDIFASRFNTIVPECPDEWLLQFVAGIKTVLLVPVIPHGVLQLGSLEKVAENVAVVACIKDSFDTLQNEVGFSVPFISNWNCLLHKVLYEDSEVVDSVKPKNSKLLSTNQAIPLFTVQDALQAFGEDLPLIHESESKKEISVFSVGLNEVSTLKGQCINNSQWGVIESNLSRFSCLEEELHAVSQYNNYNLEVLEESSEGIMKSYCAGGLIEPSVGDKDANDTGHRSTDSFFSFPLDCELHKALGLAMQRQTSDYIRGSSEDASSTAKPICNRDIVDVIEPLTQESSGYFAKGGDAVNLLEDVVANMHSGSDDTSSHRSNSVKSSTTLSGQFSTSSHVGNQSEGSALVQDDSLLWSHVKPEFVASRGNAFTNSSISSSSFKSTMTTLVDEEQQKKGYGCLQPRKGSKLSNVNKKRASPGNNQRPRPRDRQMIQDRVKELRELVPNGAKCSIDGLLDRTIKHMLFLRKTTDQAAKLKQRVHQEAASQKSENKCSHQNGTSWAFELGSELKVCPIVVEDLECPGHMLIEMLCNEHGLFLEIAQVIRGLELTILKGVMESRCDNMWAQFIVEVSRGFHRMDIFWPLMQLLQQNQNTISGKS
ncbi:transcription factor EMB1444-like isoform X1 [Vitis riparia]|uniref:transcription factor EMB1444-like isoform X1 n=1 Tax=Vitis riparia TaxID=96939 RepID=UPI00155AA368|nr:transcription factor EMB1444-like isoform X1 [Vitis riparia]XP_034693890.1 transcription factor EMB1444-like isoform X1 [Vitis riparia]